MCRSVALTLILVRPVAGEARGCDGKDDIKNAKRREEAEGLSRRLFYFNHIENRAVG